MLDGGIEGDRDLIDKGQAGSGGSQEAVSILTALIGEVGERIKHPRSSATLVARVSF